MSTNLFLDRINTRDFIAVLIICGLIVFKLTGHNGTLDTAVAVILGYYFGRRDDIINAVKEHGDPTKVG